ncbi:retropepsin-like aspartic protease family protein [Planctobacterium marinum]|uniref:Peptidase A2 domain-containing protein n=1 Tax=Planctobacterium marinum TaxID=1631968 RepID=A0AA48HRS5_9ALTE|nr:hypothetical protein MACH26_30480 [Planctobacterium marinum]
MRLVVILLSGLLALSVALNVYFYAQITIDGFATEQEDVSTEKSRLASPVSRVTTINAPSPIEIAFSEFDFDTVLSLYEQQLQASPEQAEQNRKYWFERIYSAINHAKSSQTTHPFGGFITDYLKLWPYDSEFLYLEILNEQSDNDPLELLVSLYNLQQAEISENLEVLLQRKTKQEFDFMVQQLTQLGAWDVLATSLETLMPYDQGNRELLVNLAYAYSQSGQFGLMESIIAYLPQNDAEIARLREFRDKQLAKEEVTSTKDSGIPLDRIGDQFLVSTLIQERFEALLMIDTGASTTVISSELFRSIRRNVDTEYLGRYSINTASGRVRAPIYRFKSLSVQGYRVNDIAIVVLPLDELQADGLLGMNFLRAFRFLIDQDSGSLHLFTRA